MQHDKNSWEEISRKWTCLNIIYKSQSCCANVPDVSPTTQSQTVLWLGITRFTGINNAVDNLYRHRYTTMFYEDKVTKSTDTTQGISGWNS